jgi:transcriptional repressor NrdR
MRCPYCGSFESQVKDSRPTEDHAAIRRRRGCPDCGGRFTTLERVQLREVMLVKRSGRREAFDCDKLARSIELALRKRPIAPERVERLIAGITRELETRSEDEVSTETIGAIVLDRLKHLDAIAYIRFASVYRKFTDARDFAALLAELGADPFRQAAQGDEIADVAEGEVAPEESRA